MRTEAPLRHLRILVVDDHETIRASMQILLQRRVEAFYLASDGEAAWQIWQHHTVDVVITDLRMPGLDGAALARRIRENEQNTQSGCIVIVTSASREDEAPLLADKSLFDYVVTKPVSPLALLELLENIAHKL